jgi:hypothetical protein
MADAAQTEVVDDVPPTNGAPGGTPPTVSFRPVRFNLVSMWESPATWVLVGVAGTLLALYFINTRYERKK